MATKNKPNYEPWIDETKPPSFADKVLNVAEEFRTLASKQADGYNSTRELLEGMADIGRRAAYWDAKIRKIAMRELWNQTAKAERDKIYSEVLDFPATAV